RALVLRQMTEDGDVARRAHVPRVRIVCSPRRNRRTRTGHDRFAGAVTSDANPLRWAGLGGWSRCTHGVKDPVAWSETRDAMDRCRFRAKGRCRYTQISALSPARHLPQAGLAWSHESFDCLQG